jgi:hypothetical protein
MALSTPSFKLFDDLRVEYDSDTMLAALCQAILADPQDDKWAVVDGLRIFVPATSPCVATILEIAHGTGHEGTQKTLHRLQADFFLPGARTIVQDFVRACATCQKNKMEQLHPAGLLQPLALPSIVWTDISMDFIEGLPWVNDKSVILIVVDRFSKAAHFIALDHPYSATTVACAFFAEIVHLHGIPASIVSDRDAAFTSNFWHELFSLFGVQLNMSTTFHSQSEVVNKIICMYLRCLMGDKSWQWLR